MWRFVPYTMSVLTELCGLFDSLVRLVVSCRRQESTRSTGQVLESGVNWSILMTHTAVRSGCPPLDVRARRRTELRHNESCTVQMLLYVLGESFSLDSVAARTERPSFDL